jgi:cysteine desulfurase
MSERDAVRRIYLDHTATTPLDPRVLQAMLPYFENTFGNASSIHAFGREAKNALERARGTIASAIGALPGEVVFTSGGTESDNLAIVGAWRAGRKRGRTGVVTDAAEHHAVLDTCERLREDGGAVSVVGVDSNGSVDPLEVASAMSGTTALVSVMHANNEVGTINRVGDVAEAAHRAGAMVHTDAVQSFGKIAVRADDLAVDLLSLSAHKLYGPKGIGALYIRRGTGIEPLMTGGGQEKGRRPGTENVALAAGFARAVELAMELMEVESERLSVLRDDFERALCDRFPCLLVNGHPACRLPHILNVSVNSAKVLLEGEMLVPNLDLEGIAVTSGSACSSGSMQPSHVLLAMGRDLDTARATVRFSFGRENTREDVAETLERVSKLLGRMIAH